MQSHVFKRSKGQPVSNQEREECVCGHWTTLPDATRAYACCLVGGPLGGSATTSIASCEGFRREQPWEAGPGRAGAASGRREEIERHLVLGSSLGPWAPGVFRSLKSSAGVYPWSLYLRGRLAAWRGARVWLSFGSPWAWRVRRP